MGRTAAVIWHASFCVAAGVLYFFFVLPRAPELLGETSPTLGTALRIVTGALIGLAALPVVFTLLRTRPPEFGTPKLALNLRTTSIALHVLAGALIVGAAVSEIWLSLDDAGQWLFGIYGAAAAVALLGALAFYLAFVAELPPPPPKPLKVKERSRRRGRDADEADGTGEVSESVEVDETDEADAETSEGLAPTAEDEATAAPEAEPAPQSESVSDDSDPSDGKLRNRRPTGKGAVLGRRKRTRGGVAVED
jgi:MFS family permease